MIREQQMMDLAKLAELNSRTIDLSKKQVFMSAYIQGWRDADSRPQWIPVEERLPEENTAPLVRMDLTDKFDEETILYDVVVFDGNGFHTQYDVTHWMEIVPPRKEENNERQ